MKSTPLDDFLTFLRFASVSTDPAYAPQVRACGEWVRNRLSGMGLQASLEETEGHPLVVARNEHRPGRRTVMIYGHYDVQPPDPLELWTHPPFEPHVENGIVTARGAADNKGQILAHLLGIEKTLQEKGELPVNLIVLVEGEEEIGSKHLAAYLEKNRKALACDVIVISDTLMLGAGMPTMTYAMRGISAVEISVKGPARDLHSGLFGGVVANPLKVLVSLLASLHRPDGSVAVEGFYDGIQTTQEWEKEAWKKLPITEETYRALSGVPQLDGEAGYSLLERLWIRPTLEFNGIWGGYQGAGSKTVIPSEAHAKITCRLVPGQHPPRIGELIEAHFRKWAPASVQISVKRGHGGKPYAMDPQGVNGKAAQRAMRMAFQAEPHLIRDGATIPILTTFQEILGAESLLIGLALPDCQIHSPNENFPVANLEAGMRLNQAILEELAKG